MSDLETPEADMMRDHSSLGAAPATLRLEESRPGLDPHNPDAAPDTTLGRWCKNAAPGLGAGRRRSDMGPLPRLLDARCPTGSMSRAATRSPGRATGSRTGRNMIGHCSGGGT